MEVHCVFADESVPLPLAPGFPSFLKQGWLFGRVPALSQSKQDCQLVCLWLAPVVVLTDQAGCPALLEAA